MAYLGNSPVLSQQEYRNIDDISGSFNGVTTSFALLVNGVAPIPGPQTSNQCLISVNGVIQKPDDTGASGFRISGGNIVFSSAPTGGQTFFGVILAGADYIYAGENFPDGTVSAPTITFAQDLDTGFYRSGAGEVKFTANGVNTVTFSSNGLTAPNFIPSGSSVPTNGVYLPSANNVAIATNSTQRLLIDSSGQIEAVSLGSAAAPTWSFTTDPNTGIYSPGADQVAISTGGSGRLFVDANGNISIGQSSSALQSGGTGITVFGTTASEIKFLNSTTGASGTDGTALVATTSDFNINNREVGALVFGTSNSARLRIESTGALNFTGAGTAGVTQAVSFNGSAPVNSLVIDSSGRLGVGTSSPAQRLHISGSNAGGFQVTNADNSDAISLFVRGGNAINSTTDNAVLHVGQRSDVSIITTGRVGIGTSSPSTLLHIQSTDPAFRFKRSDAGTDAYGELTTDTSGLVTMKCDPANAAAGSGFRITVDNSEALRVDSSGRVGIGTTSPLTIFDVKPSSNRHIVFSASASYASNAVVGVDDAGSESALGIGGNPIQFFTGITERARIDSSGRLLVGTSSSSAGTRAVFQGQSSGAGSGAQIHLQRDQAAGSIGSGQPLGIINFADNAANVFATVSAVVDATEGTNDYPGRLVFSTTSDGSSSPTERMRIDSQGRVNIGTIGTVPSGIGLNLFSSSTADDAGAFSCGNANTTAAACVASFYTATNSTATSNVLIKFGINNYASGSGQINANGASAAAFGTFSDARLKENIEDLPSQWDNIKSLRPVEFDYVESFGGGHQIGFIAQEMQTVYPDAVGIGQDEMLTVTAWSKTEARLVKALQEALERIESLEAEVTALKAS